jgi:hypothetical protein
LADAITEIQGNDPEKLFHWFVYCLIGFGLDSLNPRISALIDALEREVYSQLESLEEDETSAE